MSGGPDREMLPKIKKNQIKIILFIIVSLGVISSLQPQEQTVYKPFFGKDSTVHYFYVPTLGFYVDYYPYLRVNSGANENWGFKALSNESNSKLWVTNDGLWRDSVLVVDMDLAIGDSFEIVRGTKNVVTNVFWERELKHIQFDLSFLVESDSVNEDPNERYQTVFYEIVEGVGSIYPDISGESFGWYYPYLLRPDDKYYGGITVRGIWRDGSPFYIHPLWKNNWNYGDLSDLDVTEANSEQVHVSCDNDDLLRIRVSDSSSNMKVGIYDLAGKLLWADSFWGDYEYSLASFQHGTYIVKVNEYSTKILLP